MKSLNTMNSFLNEGFKIVRNGEVITLTHEEMFDFRYLDKAIDGRRSLEYFLNECEDEKEQEIASKLIEDEEACFNIEDEYLEIVLTDTGSIEIDVVENFIERNMKEVGE